MLNPEKKSYIERARRVLFKPETFFRRLKSGDIHETVYYISTLYFLSIFLSFIVGGVPSPIGDVKELVLATAASVLFVLLFLLIMAAIVNIVSKAMDGKGNLNLTFKSLAYAETGNIVGSFFYTIPFLLAVVVAMQALEGVVGFLYSSLMILTIFGALIAALGAFYSIYLGIIGISKVQKLTVGKAFVAWLFGGVGLVGILAAWIGILWPIMA